VAAAEECLRSRQDGRHRSDRVDNFKRSCLVEWPTRQRLLTGFSVRTLYYRSFDWRCRWISHQTECANRGSASIRHRHNQRSKSTRTRPVIGRLCPNILQLLDRGNGFGGGYWIDCCSRHIPPESGGGNPCASSFLTTVRACRHRDCDRRVRIKLRPKLRRSLSRCFRLSGENHRGRGPMRCRSRRWIPT
jgi:hypothetical protein